MILLKCMKMKCSSLKASVGIFSCLLIATINTTKWRCSAPNGSRVHVPDIPASTQMISDILLADTDPNSIYVYPVPSSLGCIGTSMTVEFCYKATTRNKHPVFNLLPLKQNGTNFTVTGSNLTIGSQPTKQICIDEEEQYCCDRVDLNNTIQLPGDKFAFGISSPTGNHHELLAFFPSLPEYQVEAFVHATSIVADLAMGKTFDLQNSKANVTLRIIRFSFTAESDYPQSTMVATEQVTSDPLAGGNTSVGLIIGVTVPALVIGLLAFLLITILLVIVLKKRRLKQSQEIVDVVSYSAVNQVNEQHDQIEQYHYYDTMDPMTELSTSTNEAYGKHEEATSTGEDSHCCVNDHANDPKIPTSQNVAYGDNPTSTTRNDEPEYYVNDDLNDPGSSMIENEVRGDIPTSTTRNDEPVNEGLKNPGMTITQNEAYGDTSRQISSSRGTGSLDDTGSIPTSRNEAFTGVSTNTESVDTEGTYDYVTV